MVNKPAGNTINSSKQLEYSTAANWNANLPFEVHYEIWWSLINIQSFTRALPFLTLGTEPRVSLVQSFTGKKKVTKTVIDKYSINS